MVRQEVNWKQAPLPEPPSEPPMVSKADSNNVLEEPPPQDEISHVPPRKLRPWLDRQTKDPWYVRQALRELGA